VPNSVLPSNRDDAESHPADVVKNPEVVQLLLNMSRRAIHRLRDEQSRLATVTARIGTGFEQSSDIDDAVSIAHEMKSNLAIIVIIRDLVAGTGIPSKSQSPAHLRATSRASCNQ
jgi:hypothetical protein